MDFSDVFADNVTVQKFFEDVIPRFYASRRDEFEDYSVVTVILSVMFGDTGNRYSVEVGPGGIEVEPDEMIDFPILTLIGNEADWERTRTHMREVMLAFDARRDEMVGAFLVTDAFVSEFEKLDGVLDVQLDGPDGAVEISLIFNNYEADSSFPRFAINLNLEQIMRVAKGQDDPIAVAKGLAIRGDMGLAIDLGGLLMKHFNS